MLFALFIHEVSHYAVAKALKEPISSITLTPFGGVMTYAPAAISSKGLRGFVIAAAGPAANYGCILLTCMPRLREGIDPAFLRQFISMNLTMLVLNLLPALPLDGGRMVFSLGYYFFRTSALIACLSYAGIILGVFFLAFAAYGYVKHAILNCSIILIGLYLMICAAAGKDGMLCENIYAVVQERLHTKKHAVRLTLLRVSGDSPLYVLLGSMHRTHACCFICKDSEGRICILEEQAYCEEILKSPMMRIDQIAIPIGRS